MRRPHTFRDVQTLAAEAGLIMSRERKTRHLRFRERGQSGGAHWSVATMDEAVALVMRRLDQMDREAANRVRRPQPDDAPCGHRPI